MYRLTPGAISKIQANDTSLQPVLQLLDCRKISTANSGDRYRLILSDGTHYIQGMLATQISHLAADGQLNKWTVVKITEYVCNTINNKRICIVIRCEVLGNRQEQIGNPVPIQANPVADKPPPAPTTYQYQQSPQRQQQQQQRQQLLSNNPNATIQRKNFSGAPDSYQPVASLNPYQNNWRIKVRCTAKDPVRYYSNTHGDGKLFSVDLLDKDGGEIRATAFGEAVDRFEPVFNKDSVYLISKGKITIAKKNYTHIKNDYAITLNEDTEVELVQNDTQIDKQAYKFVNIGSLVDIPPGEYVDVIGCVDTVQPISNVRSRNQQKELKRRSIIIADSTGKVEVTVWDTNAEEYDENKLRTSSVVAFKGCRVSDFAGRSLSANSIELAPTIPETQKLKDWAHRIKNNFTDLVTITTKGVTSGANVPRLDFIEAKNQHLGLLPATNTNNNNNSGNNNNAEIFSIKATVTAISHSQDKPPWYPAAPDPETKAKVIDNGKGGWFCVQNAKTYSHYEPRYILRFCATDWSGQQWVTAFDDPANDLLKVKAATAEQYLLNGETNKYEEIFQNACFQTKLFKMRAKMGVYMDEPALRYDVLSVQDIDIKAECQHLLDKISELDQIQPVQ